MPKKSANPKARTAPLGGVAARHNLKLSAPIDRWDEAIPLGNGLMGALLWGGGRQLKLSLDRGDLWDLRGPEAFRRPDFNWQTIKDAVARRDRDLIREVFEKPDGGIATPTKLPTGRLKLTLAGKGDATGFQLDLRRAVGRVELENGRVEVFCSAAEAVGVARVCGRHVSVAIEPAFAATGQESSDQSPGSVASLGYPPPCRGRTGGVVWCRQECAAGLVSVIAVGARRQGRDTLLAFTVTTNRDAADPVELAWQCVTRALDAGFETMQRGHDRYWKAFWAKSAVELGDAVLEQHYYLVNYFYGAASRRGAPPIPLQGVWTADDGALPPWRGDYHNDLNTQLTYWPYLGANHLDEGLCFLEFMAGLLPVFREFAASFYSTPGACVPGVMALNGQPLGGWHQYSFSPTNGLWVAHAFHRHWRYTKDRAFLERLAYPFCLEHARHIDALLVPDVNGKLKLPLSSSPEFHNNRLNAWLPPNSNYDLALMRWLFGAMIEMAGALGDAAQIEHWTKRLAQLDELAVGSQGSAEERSNWSVAAGLYVAPGEPLEESHRHFSHLMAIHPLGMLHVEGSDSDRQVIDGSLRVIDHLGFPFWCGYSFTWMACLTARCGRGERAWTMLKLYLDVTVSRNGFHLNGDYKQLGVLAPTYRPFTLEGNFAAAEAVHEMLLQGWGDVVRIFPAIPPQWQMAAFDNLRTEGAFLVSARRVKGKATWVRVVAEADGLLRLRDPFDGRRVKWNRRGVKKSGNMYMCELRAGEVIEGHP